MGKVDFVVVELIVFVVVLLDGVYFVGYFELDMIDVECMYWWLW